MENKSEAKEVKTAKVNGKYAMIVAAIGLIGTLSTVFINNLNKKIDKKEVIKVLNEQVDSVMNVKEKNGEFIKEYKHPIGTVITSTLNYNELCKVIGERSTFSKKTSKWAPADGRDVHGSMYYSVTENAKLPDLRAQFIRGKNEFYNDNLAREKHANGSDKGQRKDIEKYSYQKDEVGHHKITHKVFYHNEKSYGGNRLQGSNGSGSKALIEEEYNKGKETRPLNISMYYYIKINE